MSNESTVFITYILVFITDKLSINSLKNNYQLTVVLHTSYLSPELLFVEFIVTFACIPVF